MQSMADRLELHLRRSADPARAEGEKRYLKSGLEFLGVTMPQIRAAVSETVGERRAMTHDELVALIDALWAVPTFERRMAAILFLDRFAGLVSVADVPLFERLVRESGTWALVDPLATDVLGGLVGRDPDGMTPILDRWATDDDVWIRRSPCSPSCVRSVRARRSSGSSAAQTRCSRRGSSSSARRSAGCCARPASAGRQR